MSSRSFFSVCLRLLLWAGVVCSGASSKPAEAQVSPGEQNVAEQAAEEVATERSESPREEPATPAAVGESEEAKTTATVVHDDPAGELGLIVPDLDLFIPEGEFELRLHKLIDRVSFEGQVNYNFVDGDVRAFLRYRYYAYQRTYRFAVFDTLEFRDFQNSDEFERVRGTLFLIQWPHSYHHRSFLLTELDNITTNRESSQTNGRVSNVNTFVRAGFQLGTPDDDRSNAIVGEDRGEVRRLFTPYRHIGPGDWGSTVAVTWGFDFLGGEFDYLRLEAETLKRFELPHSSFLFGRLHTGTFLRKAVNPSPQSEDPRDAYLVPRREFFRLDGRQNLKGLKRKVRGTEELHTSWELLLPWFVDEERQRLRARWQTWYWVVYAGYGTAGFDRGVYSDLDSYVADAGFGFQSSFTVRGYKLFLSALLARELASEADYEFRVSVKSFH